MVFEFTLELNTGRIYYITGEVDFSKDEDPINIVAVKFEDEDTESGEELSDLEIRQLWHQVMMKVETYLQCKSIHDGHSFVN